MNTAKLKSFAPEVRRQLLDAVERKLEFVLSAETADLRAMTAARKSLSLQAEQDRVGLIERVAYTWFNRFAALRFMDALGWHPFGARILTPAISEETQPELLKLARNGTIPEELRRHTDSARLNDILDGRIPSLDPQGEVYRQLVLAACRFYNALLPYLFEKIDDETELLLPDVLLTEHSVVSGFRTEITDEDCADGPRANVEILGWLYQFYISERKDQVMARKSAVPTEDIPAVTQLFTPHWIVRYLVENSLGRLWLLNRPGSRLREHMPYYIEGEPETDFLKITKPEEIRLCDPACGSGHILTYAFDLLALIYEEEGYAPTEIPALILRHNLYGLEICPRAAQLAELALVFKAREKSRRFFQPGYLVRPQIIELRDVRFAENELRDYIHALGLGDLFNQPMLRLLHQFEEAKNFGSLIQPCLDERAIADVRRAIEAKDLGGQLFLRETHLKVLRVLEQAEALSQRYHVVVANPPYLGSNGMNAGQKVFLNTYYQNGKTDLFAAFILCSLASLHPEGLLALVTPYVWMFISSYSDLRKYLLKNAGLLNLIQLEYNAFEPACIPVCAYTLVKSSRTLATGTFIKLSEFRGHQTQSPKALEAIANSACTWRFRASSHDFLKLPSYPIIYWLPAKFYDLFDTGSRLGSVSNISEGVKTGDNARFLRRWHEVGVKTTSLGKSRPSPEDRWVGYHKGGDYRRWYGNYDFVIDWANDGFEIRSAGNSGLQGRENYFSCGITWSKLSSSYFGVRLLPLGVLFDSGSPGAFPIVPNLKTRVLLGFLSSRIASSLLKALNPTLNFQVGNVASLPWIETDSATLEQLNLVTGSCIEISKADWDNFETSWDFRDQPLLRPDLKGAALEASWRNWEAQSNAAIYQMQELETENNRLFIAAYGLDGELQPEVPEEQITLARAQARRDMAAFLSYAVGCMMGRYSLDHPGLILANAGDSLRVYLGIVGKPLAELTFAPDEDGIIPVLDGEWFDDDIVARTRDFLRATFGDATLEANVRFIEESLGKDLRRYFVTDFYKDHLQTYKKRPIYWMFQSPRKGFNALVYLHRYTKDTANTVLNRYLRDYLHKMRSRLEHLGHVQLVATTTRDKNSARKESDALRKTIRECEEYERDILLSLAQQRIELDLDDGVKVNYLKLGNALAPIAGLAAKEAE